MKRFIIETSLLFRFYVITSFREPVWLVMGLFFPICWMILFSPLLENIPKDLSVMKGNTITAFTSGMLVMMGTFSTLYVGFGLISDLRAGIVERLRVTPVHRLAPLLARSLKDGLVLFLQSCLLLLISIPMGLQVNLLGIILCLIMVLIMGVALAGVSYAMALLLKDENSFSAMLNFATQPIFLLSGIILPLAFAPGWLQTIAGFNPLSYIVEGARALFLGNYANTAITFGYIAVGILAGLSMLWASRAFKKATY